MTSDVLKIRLIILAKYAIKGILFAFFLILVYLVALAWKSYGSGNDFLPQIRGMTIQGRQVTLEQYRGKPVLVYIWGSWCPICRFSHASITRIASDYPVISIALQSGTDAEIMSHMQQHNAAYMVMNDETGELSRLFEIKGVPASFVADASGYIKFKSIGYTPETLIRYWLWRNSTN